jgi:hypothetical protein
MSDSLKTFVNRLHKAKHLIIPRIGDYMMPTNIIFPNAQTLTVYCWDKNGVYYNLNRHHFPNVERINYISNSPGEACVLFRFLPMEGTEKPTFKWRLPESASTGIRHHRFFDWVPEEYKEFIPRDEYKELVKEIDAVTNKGGDGFYNHQYFSGSHPTKGWGQTPGSSTLRNSKHGIIDLE